MHGKHNAIDVEYALTYAHIVSTISPMLWLKLWRAVSIHGSEIAIGALFAQRIFMLGWQ
ncbi:MAG: hypothetical protein Q9M16_01445 [Mariprofundus sp.]|nr:hypothetical protein [Mariprofundus sp.]